MGFQEQNLQAQMGPNEASTSLYEGYAEFSFLMCPFPTVKSESLHLLPKCSLYIMRGQNGKIHYKGGREEDY